MKAAQCEETKVVDPLKINYIAKYRENPEELVRGKSPHSSSLNENTCLCPCSECPQAFKAQEKTTLLNEFF